MEKILERLKDEGCDIDSAMGRFLNDEGFYLKCFDKVLLDTNFQALDDAINDNDIKKAFEASHGLKGVIGNMGLTPMYDELTQLTEILRSGSMDGARNLANMVLENQKTYARIYKDNKVN